MELISTNYHILEKIFTRCKNSTLLQCRLVCHQWAEEVTRILRNRGVQIFFRSVDHIEEFLHWGRPLSYTYTHFLIDISSPFGPQTEHQVPPQVVDLLDCSKDDLLELKLWYTPVPNTGDVPQPINEEGDTPVVTLKRLHTLHLLSNYINPTSNTQGPGGPPLVQVQHQMPSYFDHLSTPNLRSLGVQHLYDTECTATIIKLINSCGQGLECFKIPAKNLPSVVQGCSADALCNLRELDLFGIFNGFSCATNDTLESIIKSCPTLTKLGIEFSFRATPDKIQELLQALSKTLVEFKCTIQDRNLLARQIVPVHFIFPETMVKLKSLQIRWSNPGLVYYIDRLPALEELVLDTVWTRKIQGSIYPGGQPFQQGMGQFFTLTSLKLTQVVSVEQVEMLAKFFPRLTIFGCSFASNAALQVVYAEMKGLKWLIIERKSNVTEAEGICGVDDNNNDLLIKLGECEILEKEQLQVKRTVPYVGNLKGLERLELCQLGVSWWSLLFGVVDLPNLKTLVIQTKAFKKSTPDVPCNAAFVGFVASQMTQLRNLTLWIRHKSEKLSAEETACIEQTMSFLDELTVLNHSLCGI